MRKLSAIIPGSYDPVTRGHVDVIRRASELFDTVNVAVMVNALKQGLFTPDERLQLLECACRDIPGVKCMICDGLAAELSLKTGAKYFVKGVRNPTDFDYEYGLAQIMRHFDPDIETILLPARPELAHVCSVYARERLKYGCELTDVADPETAALMQKIYKSK